MRLMLRGKLALLSTSLLVPLGVVIWLACEHLAEISEAHTQIVESAAPSSAACFEMEINLIGTGFAVLGYMDDHDSLHLERIRDNEVDFLRAHRAVHELADSDAIRSLADCVAAGFGEFLVVAERLVQSTDRRKQCAGLLSAELAGLDDVLADLAPNMDDRQATAETDRPSVALQMQIQANRMARYLGGYMRTDDQRFRKLMEDSENEFRRAHANYRQLAAVAEEREAVTEIEARFEAIAKLIHEAAAVHDALRSDEFALVARRRATGALLEDQIQLVAERTLAGAHQRAMAAIMRTQRDGLLILVAAVAFYLGSLMCFARGLRHRIRNLNSQMLAATDQAPGAPVGSQRGDELSELCSTFSQVTLARHKSESALREAHSRALIDRLRESKVLVDQKNARLADLYQMAHRFVADVSHELRTPLTVVKEFSNILVDGLAGELNQEQCEYAGIIADRADEMTNMVTDLLDMSRHEAGLLRVRRREHRFAEIAARVEDMLRRKAKLAGVNFAIEPPGPLPAVFCDAEMIGRVIINLVTNALKFTPAGGHVRLWARTDTDNAELLRIGVSDSGPGIAPEEQAEMFARFRQVGGARLTKVQGYGLGLNIVRNLVDLNLGQLGVESQVGLGSTFWFNVPVSGPAQLAACYLRSIEHERGDAAAESLISVEVGEGDAPAADEVEVFLEANLRCKDVLIRASECRWMWLASIERSEVHSLIERVESARAEANRNRPDQSLPELRMAYVCGWRAGDAPTTLIAALDSAEHQETALV